VAAAVAVDAPARVRVLVVPAPVPVEEGNVCNDGRVAAKQHIKTTYLQVNHESIY